jgi:hypothetical protein
LWAQTFLALQARDHNLEIPQFNREKIGADLRRRFYRIVTRKRSELTDESVAYFLD